MAEIKKFTFYKEMEDTMDFNFKSILNDNKEIVKLFKKLFKIKEIVELEKNEKIETDFFEDFNLKSILNREYHIKNFNKLLTLVYDYNDGENFTRLLDSIFREITLLSFLISLKEIKRHKDLYNLNPSLIDKLIKINDKLDMDLNYIYKSAKKIIR